MTRRLFSILLALSALVVAPQAFADDAEGFVKSKQAELTALLKAGKSPANDKKIAGVFDGMLDYDSLARESLKDYWDERSEAERKEFQGILQQLVQRAYKKNLRKTLDYDISYKGSNKAKQGFIVETVAKNRTNKREEPIRIDYLLHKVDGSWRVYDIVTEGSSLVNNYRNQFRRIIEKHGFKDLIQRMKKKLDEE